MLRPCWHGRLVSKVVLPGRCPGPGLRVILVGCSAGKGSESLIIGTVTVTFAAGAVSEQLG